MNNSKEKAKELVDRFRKSHTKGKVFTTDVNFERERRLTEEAKQCALICVDEVLSSNPMIVDYDETPKGKETWHICNKSYWQQVKEEINKL